jgi:pimeloyl-ACP methyl ester carboxylesterase
VRAGPACESPDPDPHARLGGEVRDIAVPGGFVRTETLGKGPPLYLLHGWTLDRRMWLPQVPLAEHFTLVAVDRRGFGQSTAPPGLAREPDDILSIADALGHAHFHLLGMSQAGRVALRLGLAHPARVSGLILFGSPLDGLPETDEEAAPTAAMQADFRAGRPGRAIEAWKAHPLARLSTARGQSLLDAILSDYEGRDLTQPGEDLPAPAETIARLLPPTLCVVGADDTRWRRTVARTIASRAPRGTIVMIPDAGHLANMDQPEHFNAVVEDCLGAPLRT